MTGVDTLRELRFNRFLEKVEDDEGTSISPLTIPMGSGSFIVVRVDPPYYRWVWATDEKIRCGSIDIDNHGTIGEVVLGVLKDVENTL